MTRYDNLDQLPAELLEFNGITPDRGPGRRAVTVQEFEARPRVSEREEQAALFEWAQLRANQIPELGLLLAIPNGGHRHPAVGAQMKAEGVRRGVPDIFLPCPRGRWAGLFIELKIPGNTTSPEQDWWLDRLERQGYRVAVCYGFEDAKGVIEDYLAQ